MSGHWSTRLREKRKYIATDNESYENRHAALRHEAVIYVISETLPVETLDGRPSVRVEDLCKLLPGMATHLLQLFEEIDKGDYDEGP